MNSMSHSARQYSSPASRHPYSRPRSKVAASRLTKSLATLPGLPRATSRRGQTAVYIIIAIVIVVAGVLLFIFRDSIGGEQISPELMPPLEYYQTCIEAEARTAIDLAGIQGGRVALTDYYPGSEYAPFSSHLNFFGSPVQYWYYVSGNGVIKEDVPSKEEMEREIADYIEEGLANCNMERFYRDGFEVGMGEPIVTVEVGAEEVSVDVDAPITVGLAGERATKSEHAARIDSKLGKFYDNAIRIYNSEKQDAFLEDYAVDVLYTYAPVEGFELQCSPKIWTAQDVSDSLKTDLANNIQTIKFVGDYYELGENREYFVQDVPVDESVNVMYLPNWPTKVEIAGDGVEGEILIAQPIGTQQGMGILGFCYVPYHFIYDVSFPVMIQVYDSQEMFQFPLVVVIDNNVARQANIPADYVSEGSSSDVCEYRTQSVTINMYDLNLNPVDANVSYECFDQSCRIGESSGGTLKGALPACVNGYLSFRAEGYADKRVPFSSNSEAVAEVVLDREYPVNVTVMVGGREVNSTTIVTFVREDGKTTTAALPEMTSVRLSEGSYEVKAYVYGDSSLTIPSSSKTECVDVPKEGVLGFFGGTQERCFDIAIPETRIEQALIGGGSLNTYILDSDLRNGQVKIFAPGLPVPNSLEQLSDNFDIFDSNRVEVLYDE